jgi:chromosome segregation ATPase
VKTNFFSARLCAATLLSALVATSAFAQTPAQPAKPKAPTKAPAKASTKAPAKTEKAAPAAAADKIMTIDELRVCMKLQQSNEKNAEEILQAQDNFKRDQDAVKAEQAEVAKANETLRTTMATLAAERDSVSAAVTALTAKVQAAKNDDEKVALEPERAKLSERNKQYEKDVDGFNASQQTLRDRVNALNARIDAINQRSKTVNEKVEPHKQQVTAYREQCGNRRFREEDEIVIKKELAAAK